jgi:hypothetical protein
MRNAALLALLAAALLANAMPAVPTMDIFSDELDADLYDCTLTVKAAAKMPAASAVRLDLEWVNGKNHNQLAINRQAITITSVKDGKRTACGQTPVSIPADTAYTLTVLRRGSWLGLLRGQSLIFRGEVPRLPGNSAGVTAEAGWTVDAAQIQRLEPVVFADNFMRSADNAVKFGAWKTTDAGAWDLASAWDKDPKGNQNKFTNAAYAQNPFSWGGHRDDGGPTLCTTGESFWEDYTVTVSVQPGRDGAVGVMVNMPDGRTGILARWSPVGDTSATGNRLILYRYAKGELTPLAESKGGFVPEQWYNFSVVSSLDGVKVYVDRRERLNVKGVTPWRGGMALYAEGKTGVIYDDVTVYGRTLKKDLIAETQQAQINDKFRADTKGMQEWSAYQRDWVVPPGAYNYYVNRLDFYGDHWITVPVRTFDAKTGRLVMALCANGTETNSGYRAVVSLSADTGKLTYAIFRNTTQLAARTDAPLTPNVEYTFRFSRRGKQLILEQDGDKVVEATDTQDPPGFRPAYSGDGCFSFIERSNVLALGRNMKDYTFSEAPVDWLSDGSWMPTTRWSCAPQWSFLAGWSRGNAALWYKDRVVGDQAFEAFLGLKMEYPRERDIYDNRYRNLCITICGDGHDPLSGYAGVWLLPIPGEYLTLSDGRRIVKKRLVLYRNGVEVAAAPVSAYEMPDRGADHRNWFELSLHKRGGRIEFWVRDKCVLTYTDPEPLDGGVPGIWTTDNGIAVARARLIYTNPPVPRTDPFVVIAQPWYPEWANINTPLTLDFANSWSTTGKAISLRQEIGQQPDKVAPPAINGTKVVFTPTQTGDYWYRISATDGDNVSPLFHLSVPAFNPGLGRDDSHTLILYRFDEGSGTVVKDHGALGTPANLKIKDANVSWVSSHGLTYRGPHPMISDGDNGVSKLMAIAANNACTIETWLSTDSVYTATGWAGCIMTWETSAYRRNFAFGHNTQNLITTNAGAPITSGAAGTFPTWGFRTGLNHWVSTWDGKTLSHYKNGVLMNSAPFVFNTANWVANTPLLLGNQTDGQRNYLGTYYLVAIHDRCLSTDEVLRHYNAGPSARSQAPRDPKDEPYGKPNPKAEPGEVPNPKT